MPLRMVIHLPHRSKKFPLVSGERLIGSDPACDIHVEHPTVSRRHAGIAVTDEGVVVEDLGSSNGTCVDARRIDRPTAIGAGSRLAFGNVAATVEEIREGDLQTALPVRSETDIGASSSPVSASRESARPWRRRETTLPASALEEFAFRQLPGVLEELLRGRSAVETAQQLGALLFQGFPCTVVEISRQHGGRRAIWFSAHSTEKLAAEPPDLELEYADIRVRASFVPTSQAGLHEPVVRTCLNLIALAQRHEPYQPTASTLPKPQAASAPAPITVEARLQRIYADAARVAPGDVGVLIQGESGTGKEVLARYLHAGSGRPAERYVVLNCAALPRDLLELELFGIDRAVATGVDARPGKFELADQGTLVLDEIGDMALETQAKILRVLQEGEVYRLGSTQRRSARVRVLAATNRNIEAMLRDGLFRRDLYHRIAGWVVELPPLRERPRDIPNLAAHFLAREAERRGVAIAGITRSAMDALLAYDWPGNVRELRTEIARAALFVEDGEMLESSLLQPAVRGSLTRPDDSLKDRLCRFERAQIDHALGASLGDPEQAAVRLGISRATIYRRMKTLGIDERTDS